MKSFGKIYRESAEKILKDSLEDSNSVFIVNYKGIDATLLGQLRQDLKTVGAQLFVSKNSLSKRVVLNMHGNKLTSLIDGPTGFIAIEEDPVPISRMLKKFIKENETFKVRGGFLEDTILAKEDIEALGNLPSREILVAMVVYGIKSPISNFVLLLNQLILRFVIVVKAISDKKNSV